MTIHNDATQFGSKLLQNTITFQKYIKNLPRPFNTSYEVSDPGALFNRELKNARF